MYVGIFRRMFPFAVRNGLRLVTISRREYPYSTPYSPSELALLRSGNSTMNSEYFRLRSAEILNFLAWFTKKERIHRITDTQGMKRGGIVVIGWSSGFTSVAGLLAHVDRHRRDTVNLLEPYMRSIGAYGICGLFTMVLCKVHALTDRRASILLWIRH